jgi:hypothetical protein
MPSCTGVAPALGLWTTSRAPAPQRTCAACAQQESDDVTLSRCRTQSLDAQSCQSKVGMGSASQACAGFRCSDIYACARQSLVLRTLSGLLHDPMLACSDRFVGSGSCSQQVCRWLPRVHHHAPGQRPPVITDTRGQVGIARHGGGKYAQRRICRPHAQQPQRKYDATRVLVACAFEPFARFLWPHTRARAHTHTHTHTDT